VTGGNRVEIKIELSPQIAALIDRMVETGLWGDTREEVCVTLIREGIRRHWKLIEPPK
jgi:Arc/MetJ-type ribon-helix-helix transcriptional regulator